MPVQILTVRTLARGQVTAVHQAPFYVFAEGETSEQAERELARMAGLLEAEAMELQYARFDHRHHRHHWWMP